MDIGKQYPEAVSKDGYEILAQFEDIQSSLGLSTVDLINYCRSSSELGEELSFRLGKTRDETLAYLQRARSIFSSANAGTRLQNEEFIPTGIESLDAYMMGGLPVGCVTEVFGPSGAGKSQFLLWLAIQAQRSCDKSETQNCIFISTEASLETRRLHDFDAHGENGLDNISYIYCQDIETQDHIIFTQLTAKIQLELKNGRRPRAVIIDSIGHHLRSDDSFINASDYLRSHLALQEESLSAVPSYAQHKSMFDSITNKFFKGNAAFKSRISKKYYLLTMYKHLADLARAYNVAVVLANQVSDIIVDNPEYLTSEIHDPLNLNFQVGTYSGWDESSLVPAWADGDLSEEVNEVALGKPERARNNGDTPRDYSADNVFILDSSKILRPKKKIPAMGYTWSKLITHRLLLWKAYEPVITKKREGTMDNTSNQSSEPQADSLASSHKFEGYRLRRFAKVISAQSVGLSGPGAALAEFEIRQTGICEVRT